jgi:hypothetical protein
VSEPDGWDLVQGWIEASRWPVEVVATAGERGAQALERLEISTRSPLGAVVRRSAGLSVDHGWLRVLGAGGSDRLRDGVNEWSERAGLLIVGHDAAGGFFSWDEERGVLYHAPDTQAVEDLGGRGYSDWLEAMLTGDLAGFYADARWPGWEEDTRALTGDQGFFQYPPRFTAQGKDPAGDVHRGVVPMTELWDLLAARS